MGAIKRIALFVFALATILGVGILALLLFAWEPIMPAATWIAGQQWFFIVEAVLLGIVLLGAIVMLIWAIAAPGKSSRLLIEREDGEIDISRDAINSTARSTIEAHRGLEVKDVRMKIVGKRDPKLRLKIKVNPGRTGSLEQLGAHLTDEVAASVNSLTGHPLDKLRITFTKPEYSHTARGAIVTAPVTSTPSSQAVATMSASEMADEAIAGSEGASLNTAAAMAR